MNSIITTADGSHSIHHSNSPEAYHSRHGAIQESQHVFIDAGLGYFKRNSTLRLLEIGFGTGLNAFLTLISSPSRHIHYTAFEPYPLSSDLYSQLNYPAQLSCPNELFFQLHSSAWETEIAINESFTLCKRKDAFSTATIMNSCVDLVYFDAFSPDIEPQLWTLDIFKLLYKYMSDHSVLVTYSAKGVVKSSLRDAGFSVERLAGPPHKRHMIRAIK